MLRLITLIVVGLLSGCVSLETTEKQQTANEEASLINIRQAAIGMSRVEIDAILGNEVKIGYEKSAGTDQGYKQLTFSNPYRQEIVRIKGKEYRVAYYLTYTKRADDVISDDELTPLVFENDRLIGKDWDFLTRLKVKEESNKNK